ncbi:MAG TPA: ATP-dependent zinc metalloprotease FtsH [Anaerolineales bacterium]|nr:ATP-dependent zinc metalloprotease FtsH [Anaerolineales bacterium]
MNPRLKNILLYLVIALASVGLVLGFWYQRDQPTQAMPISEVSTAINEGRVQKITEQEDRLLIEFVQGSDPAKAYALTSPADGNPQEMLIRFGADIKKVEWVVEGQSFWLLSLEGLFGILPFIFIFGLLFFFYRQMQGSNSQAMNFGRSRARMFTGDQPTVTFDDVAGVDEAKEDLAEVVEFLRDGEKFKQLGARIPKGVLLVGPPGTGKTLLAKAVSGEAGVPFFSISGSEFVEMFVGVGASRVRDLFDQAKRHSPCIIFIDEIDAVGRQRGAGLGGSHDEREQTLNQILVEMDGFDTDTHIIIIAATNRPDILDPALMRPGRFDRRVIIDRPDVKGREQILKVHSKDKPLANDVDLSVIARATPGFSGADLENLFNEAAILSARKNLKATNMEMIESAIERVAMGPERKSRLMSEKKKRLVAYHEAGHAVVAHVLPDADAVRKVTIVPRGMAGGLTWLLPDDDPGLASLNSLKAQLSVSLGGRAAEELVLGRDEITTGASGDLQQVARTARAMITQWGMSDKLAPVAYGKKEEMIFLGREISEQRDFSEAVAEKIDSEVNLIVNEAYDTARRILTEKRAQLDAIATALMDVETLNAEDFVAVFDGKPIHRKTTSRSLGQFTSPTPESRKPESGTAVATPAGI